MENIKLNRLVSRILALGIYSTIFFYIIGIFLMLIKNNSLSFEEHKNFYQVIKSFKNIFILGPEPFIYIGTLILITTPIFRVFVSVFFFYKNGDKKFFYVTLIVAIILIVSIFSGIFFSIKLG